MALLLPLLLGITALSVDASFMYDKRNQLYAAADAAAKSAAIEVRRGNTNPANLQAFAAGQVSTLGNPGSTPPSMSIGNSTITMPGCEIANGGDLVTTNPNAAINAQGIGVSGTCSGFGCANMTNLSTGVAAPEDPLAGLPAPPNPGGCAAATNPSGPLTPGCYSRITATSTLNLAGPGVFYVTGPILIGNNTTVRSTGGVMIYLAGSAPTGPCTTAATAGCINVAHNANVSLSAMTSGPYTAILFFQDPANHLNAQFDGNNPIYNISGAMYFPGADVSFRNGLNATNDCMSLWRGHLR